MNYQDCTLEELTIHFMTLSRQAINQQIKYYEWRQDEALVLKIKKARILMKQQKLAAKLGELG